jgi:hypothetical protein
MFVTSTADLRQAVGFCMISALAACMDGFQTKIPGSIIANRGFINQFGEFPETGYAGLADYQALCTIRMGSYSCMRSTSLPGEVSSKVVSSPATCTVDCEYPACARRRR